MVDFGLYLNKKPDEVLLPLKYVPPDTRPGDVLRVFVYTDSEDRPVATTLAPKAVAGEFAYLKVKDVVDFGAFLDWGLEKDLLVPTSQQQERMRTGCSYVVKVCLDDATGRVYGTSRITAHCDKHPEGLSEGEKVDLLIYGMTKIGISAVVNNRYAGLLYKNDVFTPLSVGDKITGYISRVRADGKIDLTLKSPGYRSISDSSARVLEILTARGGFIACHDKTDPEEIRRIFSLSKKEFKKAVGGLYKSGRIRITDWGIQIQ